MMNTFKSGDWTCSKCKYHNFASRDKCYKCQDFKSKSFLGIKKNNEIKNTTNHKIGDWICPTCNDLVFGSRPSCRKCGQFRMFTNEEKEDKEDSVCVICMENPPNIAFITCGHISICEKCSKDIKDLKNCPICRMAFDSSNLLKIFQV